MGWLHTARFLTTAPRLEHLPPGDVPEVAWMNSNKYFDAARVAELVDRAHAIGGFAQGERTKIANREKADLFVSIHANSAENRSAEGFETYFLSAAKTEDARRVARMENSAVRYENPSIDPESLGELNFILWDLAQNEYLRESSTLAESVQEEIDRRLALRSRGVKQAGFFVLNGAFMPAILFEMAFISNPREESLLDDPAFQKDFAEMVDRLKAAQANQE